MGSLRVGELEKKLSDKGLTLSPLAVSAGLSNRFSIGVFNAPLATDTHLCTDTIIM